MKDLIYVYLNYEVDTKTGDRASHREYLSFETRKDPRRLGYIIQGNDGYHLLCLNDPARLKWNHLKTLSDHIKDLDEKAQSKEAS